MKKRKVIESHPQNKGKKKMYDVHFCATGTPSLFEISGDIFIFFLNLLFRIGVQPMNK